MSVRVMSHIWQHSTHKGSELLTLLAIADHADDEGNAYPSVKALCEKTRLQLRNMQYILRKLRESTELQVHEGQGPHGRHLFHIAIEGCKDCMGAKFAGVQTLRGATHCMGGVQPIAQSPSVSPPTPPSLSPPDKDEPSGESSVGQAPTPAQGAFATIPPLGTLAVRKPKKPRKPLPAEDWLREFLIHQDFVPDMEFADVNDADLWACLSHYVPVFDEELVRREFAKMGAYFIRKPLKKARSRGGWQSFLDTWFKKAGEQERRMAYAATQRAQEVHIHYAKR